MKKILIINNDTKHIKDFISLLSPYYKLDIVHYLDFSLDTAHSYDAIILSGGANHAVTGQGRWLYQKEFELVKTTTTPLIGVCLGFQIIAYGLDLEIIELEEPVHGICKIRNLQGDFFAHHDELDVYQAHRFAVSDNPDWRGVESIEILARSDTGVEVFQHRERDIYGFQFHPEVFHDKLESRRLFLSFLEKILR